MVLYQFYKDNQNIIIFSTILTCFLVIFIIKILYKSFKKTQQPDLIGYNHAPKLIRCMIEENLNKTIHTNMKPKHLKALNPDMFHYSNNSIHLIIDYLCRLKSYKLLRKFESQFNINLDNCHPPYLHNNKTFYINFTKLQSYSKAVRFSKWYIFNGDIITDIEKTIKTISTLLKNCSSNLEK